MSKRMIEHLYEASASYRQESRELAQRAAETERMSIHADDPYQSYLAAQDMRAQSEYLRSVAIGLIHHARVLAGKKGVKNAN